MHCCSSAFVPVPPTAGLFAAGKRVVVLESRLIGSGQSGRSLGDMTSWHTGLFSSLERWTSTEQRKQVTCLFLSWSCSTGTHTVCAWLQQDSFMLSFESKTGIVESCGC